jgi:hypothetical protein
MLNKEFAKMSKMGGPGSVGTRSIASRGTRRTGTASRKSKQEENFYEMEIEEL